MKRFRVSVFVFLAACTAASAQAQYGLYGAPDMLRLQPAQPAAVSGNAAVAPMAYQTEPIQQGTAANNAYTLAPADPSQSMAMAVARGMPPVPGGQPSPSPAPAPSPTPGPVGPIATDSTGMPSYAPGGMGGCGVGCGNLPPANCGCGWDGCNLCNGCPWYASVLGLAMTRDKPNKLWVSYENSNEANQIMNTQDANVGWEGGGEITFGRYFCCNQWSLEATYWTLAELAGSASVSLPAIPAASRRR